MTSNLYGLKSAIEKQASYQHSSNLMSLIPGGSIMKSVADDESVGEWAGRGVTNLIGAGAGSILGGAAGAGLGALSHKYLDTDKNKSLALGLVLGKLIGGLGGTYTADKYYDSLMDKRIKNRKIKNREADYEDQKKKKEDK